jgi:hypothetical protein
MPHALQACFQSTTEAVEHLVHRCTVQNAPFENLRPILFGKSRLSAKAEIKELEPDFPLSSKRRSYRLLAQVIVLSPPADHDGRVAGAPIQGHLDPLEEAV